MSQYVYSSCCFKLKPKYEGILCKYVYHEQDMYVISKRIQNIIPDFLYQFARNDFRRLKIGVNYYIIYLILIIQTRYL